MKIAAYLAFVIAIFHYNAACSQNLSKQQWKDDVIELQEILKEKHVNLYHTTDSVVFEREFKKLLTKIDSLKDYEIILEISRLVALAGDGHTSFFPTLDQQIVHFPLYPLVFGEFYEGEFTLSVPSNDAAIAGSKLISIDGMPVREIRERMKPFIPRDNDAELTYTFPDYLINAYLLNYLGVTKDQTKADFSFEKDGKLVNIELHAVPDSIYGQQDWWAGREVLRKTAQSIHPTFLFLNKFTLSNAANRYTYWSRPIPEKKTLFFQYLSCFDQKNRPTFLDFVRDSVFNFLEKNPDYKLVIDMRYNSGGEPMTASPLILGIQERPELFQKHRPIVLVGTRTFSAAATNVMQLKRFCNAILIGQLSRARPNSPSEGRGFELRHSKLEISISTAYVRRLPTAGSLPYMPMDRVIPVKFSDYIRDVDKTFDEGINWNYQSHQIR